VHPFYTSVLMPTFIVVSSCSEQSGLSTVTILTIEHIIFTLTLKESSVMEVVQSLRVMGPSLTGRKRRGKVVLNPQFQSF
jgi:hypothetical protein